MRRAGSAGSRCCSEIFGIQHFVFALIPQWHLQRCMITPQAKKLSCKLCNQYKHPNCSIVCVLTYTSAKTSDKDPAITPPLPLHPHVTHITISERLNIYLHIVKFFVDIRKFVQYQDNVTLLQIRSPTGH